MKKILCLICLLFICTASFAQFTDEQSITYKKNNIAAISGSYITIKDGMLDLEDTNDQIFILDDSGRLWKLITYKLNEKSGTMEVFHYNTCNKPDTISEYAVNEGKQVLSQHAIYTFDKCNMVKQTIVDGAGRTIGTQIKYEYDNKGQKIKETSANGDTVTGIIKYNYGADYTEEIASFPGNIFWYHNKKYFDGKKNLVKEISISPNGKGEEETITYDYNNGNMVAEKHFTNGKPTYALTYEYDADNLLVEQISRINNNGTHYETIVTKSYTRRQ